MERRLLVNALKTFVKYAALPFPGVLGIYASPALAPMLGVEPGVLRDIVVTYLSASVAFTLRDAREEFEAWRIRRAYGKRIVPFHNYILHVKREREGSYGRKYTRLLDNLTIGLTGGQVYLDGFVDYVFDPDTRPQDVILEPSKCKGCLWTRTIEWVLVPYERVLEDLFLKAPAWNELHARILGLAPKRVPVEPVPYYYTFLIHQSPDMRLPGKHRGTTLRDVIEPMLIDDDGKLVPLEEYRDLPVPGSLGINSLVVACRDNRIILPKRGPYVSISPNTYSVGVSGSVDWKTVAGARHAGLDLVLSQELGEAYETSPGLGLYRYIVPLGIARSVWLLGKPEIYLAGFVDIRSDPESLKRFAKFGRYAENKSYEALSVTGSGPLNSCRQGQPSAEEFCQDLCRVYESLLKFVLSKGEEASFNLHLMLVLLAVFLHIHCNCQGMGALARSTIKEIASKRTIRTPG